MEPPDRGRPVNLVANSMPTLQGNSQRSYAQTVTNSSTPFISTQRVLPPLVYNPRVFHEKDGVPIVKFSMDEIKEMEKQFDTTVVAKFSAGRPTMAKISEVISNEWGLAAPASLCLVDPRHVMIYLRSQEDCVKALARDTNVMEKALYRVFRWDPDFSPKHEPVHMAAWVKLPGLPTKFFNPDTIAVIGNAIGKFLRVDSRTKCFSFAMYARLCVEIDVTKPRKEKIWISTGNDSGFYQRVIYESKLLYCSKCGLHGHDLSICRKANASKGNFQKLSNSGKDQFQEDASPTDPKNHKSTTAKEVFINPTVIQKQGNAWRFVEKGKASNKANIVPQLGFGSKSPFAVLDDLTPDESTLLSTHSKSDEGKMENISAMDGAAPNIIQSIATNISPEMAILKGAQQQLIANDTSTPSLTEMHEADKNDLEIIDTIISPVVDNIVRSEATPIDRSRIGKSKEYHGEEVPSVEIPMFPHKEAENLGSEVSIKRNKQRGASSILEEPPYVDRRDVGLFLSSDDELEDFYDSDFIDRAFRVKESHGKNKGKKKAPTTPTKRITRARVKIQGRK